jgi:16S rRNA (cytidine1402-2'-O)-methyltransferase
MTGFLAPVLEGENLGLLSEAGVPCVADPGAAIVQAAHQRGVQVVPLSGPSSIIMALMASGLNGQNFAFNGYLPIDKNERMRKLKHLELLSRKEKQTQLFMEAPYRNNQLLEDILRTCDDHTRLCIAADLTLPDEFLFTKTIKEWRQNKPDLHKRPVMFAIG